MESIFPIMERKKLADLHITNLYNGYLKIKLVDAHGNQVAAEVGLLALNDFLTKNGGVIEKTGAELSTH